MQFTMTCMMSLGESVEIVQQLHVFILMSNMCVQVLHKVDPDTT